MRIRLRRNIDKVRINVTHRMFTLSNALSLSRIVFAILIIAAHEAQGPGLLFWMLVFTGILTDYLDGWVARLLNQVSELGKALDPVSDKVMALILFAYAVWLGRIPMWFISISIIRDLLISAGSLHIRSLRGKVAMSVTSGKVFVNALAIYWIVVMAWPDERRWAYILLIACVTLFIQSSYDYLIRYRQIVKGADFN
jgi:CDP-diacylglycerol--glycerol-3-phosphate 3-phosphatidyltransferase